MQTATIHDLTEVRNFTDFWLAGRGKRVNAPGASNDCFISPSQHKKYITKYRTYILKENGKIIGWAVTQYDGSLIHFLIAGTHRGKGHGRKFLKDIGPTIIRSKNNQQTGNPAIFYEKLGYKKIETIKSNSRLDIDKIRPDRKKNIDIYKLKM